MKNVTYEEPILKRMEFINRQSLRTEYPKPYGEGHNPKTPSGPLWGVVNLPKLTVPFKKSGNPVQ